MTQCFKAWNLQLNVLVQITPMKPSNKTIAIQYLDIEIAGSGVSGVMKRVKSALKKEDTTTLEFNTFALEVDPRAQTVTLLQDWDACEPEEFSADEFVSLVGSSRRRYRE